MTFTRGMQRSWDQHDAASTARAREAFRFLEREPIVCMPFVE